ncbi:hypothetical protein F2Q69_00062538 [Brassica cretica]|uniref:Uncharacterized protein n=1 Tax=Brassica cretica TaxID=69181 RepID=A0A8S9RD83_BRACR|nr:hypothetical protein F2Q69_00062538 [Brassica cretica]
MLAAKVFDDRYYNNAYYARVGGVSTRELNRLEMTLLFALDFKLQVDPHTFHAHCCLLEKQNSDGIQIEWPIKEACRLDKETWRKSTPDASAAAEKELQPPQHALPRPPEPLPSPPPRSFLLESEPRGRW